MSISIATKAKRDARKALKANGYEIRFLACCEMCRHIIYTEQSEICGLAGDRIGGKVDRWGWCRKYHRTASHPQPGESVGEKEGA